MQKWGSSIQKPSQTQCGTKLRPASEWCEWALCTVHWAPAFYRIHHTVMNFLLYWMYLTENINVWGKNITYNLNMIWSMLQKCVLAEEIIFNDHFGKPCSDHIWSLSPSSTLVSWGKSLILFMPISLLF